MAFFHGGHKSKWYLVAFGMIGASISGVSFVSVPGMVKSEQMTYLQMCLGFIPGYVIVAFVLLPLYYKMHLVSIYSFLQRRFGTFTCKTGAIFFFLGKLTRISGGLLVVATLLQYAIFDKIGIPFILNVCCIVCFIWLYTKRSGIQSLVRTDVLQTFCMLLSLILIITIISQKMSLYPSGILQMLDDSPMNRVFVFSDWRSHQFFWKQFLSGIFIVIVMTGLDQDMMQKNLTCKTLQDAQKDMCCYGFAFVPINFLLLLLGVLLYGFCGEIGFTPPEKGDELLPVLATSGLLGESVFILFTLGITAAALSSADSALTALTTSFCIDVLGMKEKELNTTRSTIRRKYVHICCAITLVLSVLLLHHLSHTSLLDTIYALASYTYGPLLGLFTFGFFTRYNLKDSLVPFVAIFSPLFCLILDRFIPYFLNYHFGYELLIINGAISFIGLWLIRKDLSIRT